MLIIASARALLPTQGGRSSRAASTQTGAAGAPIRPPNERQLEGADGPLEPRDQLDRKWRRRTSGSVRATRRKLARASERIFSRNFCQLLSLACLLVLPLLALEINQVESKATGESGAKQLEKLNEIDTHNHSELPARVKEQQEEEEEPKENLPQSLQAKTQPEPENTTKTTTTTTTEEEEEQEQNSDEANQQQHDSSTRDDAHDAADSQSVPAGGAAEGQEPADYEKLVELQSKLERKVKQHIMSAARTGFEAFQELSLSGPCANSIMNFVSALGGLKSFAFKFVDASAKIPSGVLNGLLSDFGDFDQCLAIRSNPEVQSAERQVELDQGTYSGKYCLLSVRPSYKLKLHPKYSAPGAQAPEGIISDGILWDGLMRAYWTSNSSKSFQVAVCVPSKCQNDDIRQLYEHYAGASNIQGEVLSCQDGDDLMRQHQPDSLQVVILYIFGLLLSISGVATFFHRYHHVDSSSRARDRNHLTCGCSMLQQLLLCFSLTRSWNIFIGQSKWRQRSHVASMLPQTRTSILGGYHQIDDNNFRQFPAKTTTNSEYVTFIADNNQHATCPTQTHLWPFKVDMKLERETEVGQNSPQLSYSSSRQYSVCASREPNSSHYGDTTRENSIHETPREHKTQNRQKTSLLDNLSPQHDTAATHELDPMLKQAQLLLLGRQLIEGDKQEPISLSHLSGLRLVIIIWITIGHSFLYPSANNYQYYRSIMSMNIMQHSVWFATTNFLLGIDMLLYITGFIFVYKSLADHQITRRHHVHAEGQQQQQQHGLDCASGSNSNTLHRPSCANASCCYVVKKILMFWPTYMSVIGLAVLVPLVSDGPMWPEMVSRRLGESCRKNWWSNLLMINNFYAESEICLPSSWFVSVLMQLFILGSIVLVITRKLASSRWATLFIMSSLAFVSAALSYVFAYQQQIRAPAIQMDETFVMEMDDGVFRSYTSLFSNSGPFLVGMMGGHVAAQARKHSVARKSGNNKLPIVQSFVRELIWLTLVACLAVAVLSSVFFTNYTRHWASFYWASYRIGWSIVTGFIVHQCATKRWKLLHDLLSLSAFKPLSKLIFIAYLVYPIYIHLHSGHVRDGLHVSVYNMMNIYITRLVLTFATALVIHLLVELPFCSAEDLLISRWLAIKGSGHTLISTRDQSGNHQDARRTQPLLMSHINNTTTTTTTTTTTKPEHCDVSTTGSVVAAAAVPMLRRLSF